MKAINKEMSQNEIISYYEKLGWVKGAKFRNIYAKDRIYTLTKIEVIDEDIWVHDECVIFGDINNCTLIKEPTYPKSWKELKEIDGFYIANDVPVVKKINYSKSPKDEFLDVFRTEKQALSCLAFAQLSQLVAEMNGDWQPNWNDHNQCKYVIDREFDTIYKCTTTVIFHPLAFKTAEARDFSFQHHELIWKQYWQI